MVTSAYWDATVGFLLLQRFSEGLAVEYSSCVISVLDLGLCVCCVGVLMSTSPLHWLNNLYVYEPQHNIGRGLCARRTGLSRPVIHYWPFQGGASVVVYSRCHCSSVYFLFILFRIARWPSAGKELSSWLTYSMASKLYVFLFNLVSSREDVEFDCISSWSLPFHLICVINSSNSFLWIHLI